MKIQNGEFKGISFLYMYMYETIVLHTTRFVFLQKNVVSICRTKWLK